MASPRSALPWRAGGLVLGNLSGKPVFSLRPRLRARVSGGLTWGKRCSGGQTTRWEWREAEETSQVEFQLFLGLSPWASQEGQSVPFSILASFFKSMQYVEGMALAR